MKVVKGRVVDGLGEGGWYVKLYSSIIEKTLGITPYPGTLNVELVDPPRLDFKELNYVEIKPPKQGLGGLLAVKALIKDIPVYIVKPVVTRHPPSIIEVISAHHLRKKLGLKTGDLIEIILL
ncbi:MAG: CTP-dependent riboflavin kinase [Desulfurococcus sp.]|nr:CTP-dependent riboflavin kinase [Desulfurococcus sp.]